MGTKRIGLARVEALIENLKRDINLKSSHSNYLRFMTADWDGMSVSAKTDANSRTGFALVDGTVIENAVDGGTGASAITLPAATGTGAVKTANGTSHNVITIATTATNNQTNVGAELCFYCATDGFWRVSFRGSELGDGSINATWTFG
jgi:hypothetical protein